MMDTTTRTPRTATHDAQREQASHRIATTDASRSRRWMSSAFAATVGIFLVVGCAAEPLADEDDAPAAAASRETEDEEANLGTQQSAMRWEGRRQSDNVLDCRGCESFSYWKLYWSGCWDHCVR